MSVSERTLLPVVLPVRYGRSLDPLLVSLGVPADDIAAERAAMQEWVIGKTANRRIVGSLNDLGFQLQVGLHHRPNRQPLEHSLWLARTPLKVIEYGAPDHATVAAFAARRALHAASCR